MSEYGYHIGPDAWQADLEALRTQITRLEAQSEARKVQTKYWQQEAQKYEQAALTATHRAERAEEQIQSVRYLLAYTSGPDTEDAILRVLETDT